MEVVRGGRRNGCVSRVDRHLTSRPDKAALIWVPEPEARATEAITYQHLPTVVSAVNEFAALLCDWGGVHTGDRVTFHRPMVPEPPVVVIPGIREKLRTVPVAVSPTFSDEGCVNGLVNGGDQFLGGTP